MEPVIDRSSPLPLWAQITDDLRKRTGRGEFDVHFPTEEERADLVKHHLWVLWTDYFKPAHLEKFPQLHTLFWNATKAAGESKKTNDVSVAQDMLNQIAEIDKIFWETKK